MISKGAKNVVLFDFQEPYSQGLADAAEKVLKAKGVTTSRQSVSNTTTDFSSFVTKVPSSADFVFFPTQKPGDAQNFAQQLIEQGKKAKVFGGDGSNDASQFKVPGSYVSNFAPDISGIAADKAIIAGWKKDNPKAQLGSFGPPSYLATQVALQRDQVRVRRGQGQDQRSARRRQEREEGADPELDPRGQLPLLDEVERPAEREVLHLRDPVERLVQARRLIGRDKAGRPGIRRAAPSVRSVPR